MLTGEIVDLANERRLSAVLDFAAPGGGELLILNGGSRAEELVVITIVDAQVRTELRAAYCIDSGTSMQIVVPVGSLGSVGDITVRIIGGHGEMVLASPKRPKLRRMPSIRSWATLAAALLLSLLAGGRLDSPGSLASADPEPAPAEAPLIRPNVSLHVPAELPSVVKRATLVRTAVVAARPVRPASRRVALSTPVMPAGPASAAVPMATAGTRHLVLPRTPAPRMTDLRVPSTVKSGDFVPVSFGAVARQVKIVASIGPTIVSNTIIGAQQGVIAIRSPKSDLDSRVMTVRAYAQDGNRSSTLQAMVILVRP